MDRDGVDNDNGETRELIKRMMRERMEKSAAPTGMGWVGMARAMR